MSIINSFLSIPLPILNHWGYWVVLLFATFEAAPLIGLLVPGMSIVIAGGFLARLGILDIGDVIFFAAVGAIAGDLIGYFIGRKYGYRFISKYGKYFFFKKEHLEKTKKLINKHTGKTLIIGRFNSLTRSFAPFVAGSTGVPLSKFLTYNIVGGISWAFVFVYIGYAFGQSYEIALKYIDKFTLIVVVLGLLIIYLYKTKHIYLPKITRLLIADK